MPPETCPNCGAEVPHNAKACPECGSDENTGWSEEAYASSLDLPDEDFRYDEFVKKEFGGKSKPAGIGWLWWTVALLTLLLLLFFYIRQK